MILQESTKIKSASSDVGPKFLFFKKIARVFLVSNIEAAFAIHCSVAAGEWNENDKTLLSSLRIFVYESIYIEKLAWEGWSQDNRSSSNRGYPIQHAE